MKIKFVDLEGKIFVTNGVPFENLVLIESYSRSDKTWKNWRGWSENFTSRIADTIDEETEAVQVDSEGRYMFRGYSWNYDEHPLMSKKFFLFGHLIRVDRWIEDTIQWETRSATYEIVADNGEIIFSYNGEYNSDDWKIIADLSGQAERRRARIAISQQHGMMAPVLLSMLGMEIPNKKKLGDQILPLMECDFEKSERGGFIVRGFGKFAISRTNKSGYYKVTAEKPRVRFITLVEEFKKI